MRDVNEENYILVDMLKTGCMTADGWKCLETRV